MDVSALDIVISREALHKEWLLQCYLHAQQSIHPSTHNAALIIRDNAVILAGVNNLPPGVSIVKERFEGENKHIYPNHAERDVIYRAARAGIPTQGLTMVMPWLPCIPCTNAVISSGIQTLVMHKQMIERTKERWREELRMGVQLMKEAGLNLIAYDGAVGHIAYMHGTKWDA